MINRSFNMNFHEFATKFKIINTKLHKQPDNVVPRIFPTCSPNPKGKNYPLYCKYHFSDLNLGNQVHLMLAMINRKLTKFTKMCGMIFLNTDHSKSHVSNWIDSLQNVIESNQETISEHDKQQGMDDTTKSE